MKGCEVPTFPRGLRRAAFPLVTLMGLVFRLPASKPTARRLAGELEDTGHVTATELRQTPHQLHSHHQPAAQTLVIIPETFRK